MERLNEYVEGLEEERRKIQVFKSELPLCLELVTQAIDACRQQMSGTTMECHHAQSDCSEKTSGNGPVFEEFIPIKRTSSSDEDEQQSDNPNNNSVINYDNEKSLQKSDWLRSVQLWSHTPDPPLQEDVPRKESVMEVKGNSPGVFHAFESEKSVGTAQALMGSSTLSVAPMARSSTLETDGSSDGGSGSKKEEKGGQSQKKSRRSWSSELHKLFLHALQQLGGSHVATPKQIRELMNVDGLTNDEVKSHLQKYRLHTRRPNSSLHNNNPRAPPQFVVVRGIWVQPPEYTAVTAGEASKVDASNGMYAPVLAAAPVPLTQASASLIQPRQHKQSKSLHSDQKGSHSECRVHSNSSSISISTSTSTSTSTSSSTHIGPSSRVLVPVL